MISSRREHSPNVIACRGWATKVEIVLVRIGLKRVIEAYGT